MQPINIYMLCDANPAESFGQIGLELARHFTRFGATVDVHSRGERQHPAQDAEIAAICAQDITEAPGAIYMGFPDYYHKHGEIAGKKIAVTMWETTRMPAVWLPHLNELDAIVTPCHFCKQMFIDNGVTVPIHVIPLGISPVFEYAERPTDRPFTYYVCLDRGKRKGGWTAIKAFVRAFGNNPDYRLIVKQRKSLSPVQFSNPNIYSVADDLTVEELYKLYLQADVCINPNRGEGFGLIPREASATGCISLATCWAGTADDIGLWGVPLPYTMTKADALNEIYPGVDLGEWAEPSFSALVDTIARVAEYRHIYRSMAKDSARWVRELYSWEKFAKGVLEVWNDL